VVVNSAWAVSYCIPLVQTTSLDSRSTMKFHSITFLKSLLCLTGEVNTLCIREVLGDRCASVTNKI
jgi:hypothetical protein